MYTQPILSICFACFLTLYSLCFLSFVLHCKLLVDLPAYSNSIFNIYSKFQCSKEISNIQYVLYVNEIFIYTPE